MYKYIYINLLCKDCYACILQKNGKVTCKNGYFKNVDYKKSLIFSPSDFDCWQGENMDE